MKSLYIPDVERNPKPGVYQNVIASTKEQHPEYPKIWDLFAFRPDVTNHLGRFTQGVLRSPASIDVAMRELIAAFTSYKNACGFCTKAHAAAAGELLGDHELVWSVLRDLERSPLAEKDKQLLRFVEKMTTNLPAIGAADVGVLHDAGWDDEAIYHAITTCALFNFYNRWITATGVPEMSPEAHRRQGEHLAANGYARD